MIRCLIREPEYVFGAPRYGVVVARPAAAVARPPAVSVPPRPSRIARPVARRGGRRRGMYSLYVVCVGTVVAHVVVFTFMLYALSRSSGRKSVRGVSPALELWVASLPYMALLS